MAIVATPGAANANSYVTSDEADAYFETRLFSSAWTAASDDSKEAALIWSCRLLDAAFKWRGVTASNTQALAWPRIGLLTFTGFPLADTVIPQQLKNAHSEFAGILLSGDRTADNPDLKILGGDQSVTSIKAGPVALTFGGGSFTTWESFEAFIRSQSSDFAYLSRIVPDSVRFLLSPKWYIESSLKRKAFIGVF